MSEKRNNTHSSFKNFIAGGFGGICAVLSGHPFDTIKVRLQTMPRPKNGGNPIYSGTLDCVKQTLRNEGFSGFYKGMSTPIIGSAPIFALSFMGFGMGKNFFAENSSEDLNLSQLAAAGGFSGILTTVIVAPGERIKCILQCINLILQKKYLSTTIKSRIDQLKKISNMLTAHIHNNFNISHVAQICNVIRRKLANIPSHVVQQNIDGSSKYKGPFHVAKSLFSTGGIYGLYKGTFATLLRDVPASAAYFASYELIQQCMAKNREEIGILRTVFAGGMAGIFNWIIAIAPDVLKSRYQTAPEGKYSGIIDVFSQTLKNEGPAALFKGIVPVMMRAFPANACCFIGYEVALQGLS